MPTPREPPPPARGTVVSQGDSRRDPICPYCRAGDTLSFNWRFAQTTDRLEFKRDLSVFSPESKLRSGTLMRCTCCRRHWYLDEAKHYLHIVDDDRVALIWDWNRAPITLATGPIQVLTAIGETPTNNLPGTESREFPAAVTTRSGHRFERAIVTFQRHPPFEQWRTYRLASEIADVSPSLFALPHAVRLATVTAAEIRMGLAPTTIRLPDGTQLSLNGRTDFLLQGGCDAGKVSISGESLDLKTARFQGQIPDIVYFVADWDSAPRPTIVEPQQSPLAQMQDIQPSGRQGFWQRVWKGIGFRWPRSANLR